MKADLSIKNTWLDKFHIAERILIEIDLELKSLSKAFSITGNEKIAKQLYDIGTDLIEAKEMIDGGIRSKLNIDGKHSADMTKSVLELALSNVFK